MADERGIYNIEATDVEIKKEIASIDKEISKLMQDRLDIAEKYSQVDKRLLTQLQEQYDKVEKLGKKRIDIEETIMRVQNASTKLSGLEKDVSDSMLYGLRKKLIMSNEEYKMEKEIADALYVKMEIQQRLLDNNRKQIEAAQQFLGTHIDIFKYQSRNYDFLRKSIPTIGEAALGWAAVLSMVQSLFSLFTKMDEELAKFRIEMGMMRSDVGRISRDIKNVATDFTSIGVTTEGARIAAQKLGEELGGIRVVSKDLIEDSAVLKSQLGVSEEISAGFYRNMAAVGRTTAQSQRRMAWFTKELTTAAGVPLNMVMQDVAKMSSNALSLVSRIPLQLIKATTEARRMGTSLNKMADAGAQLMNFTESVQDEMEASVLVGTGINVQLARELAYRGKLVESTRVMLSEARRLNFMAMDFFQKQAFAKAFGRSVEELTKMVTLQKQLQEARNMESLREEVSLIDRINTMREEDLNNEALQTELSVKREANQARLQALQQQWNQLLMEAMRVLFPIFDIMLKIAIVVVKTGPAISMWTSGFLTIAKTLSSLGSGLKNVWKTLNFITPILNTIAKGFNILHIIARGVLYPIVKLFEWMGKIKWIITILNNIKFLVAFSKIIPVIGWVIAGLQFIYVLSRKWVDIWTKDGPSVWRKIGDSILAVFTSLFDVLIKPFWDALKWIWSWFGPGSPSKIGLLIVEGLLNAGNMIFNAIIYPFKRGFEWIVKMFSGKPLFGSGPIVEKNVIAPLESAKIATEAIPVTKTVATIEPTSGQQRQKEGDSVTLTEILKSIRTLNDNLLSGKIGIFVDGQLLSATLARQTAFRGGYGTNQINMI